MLHGMLTQDMFAYATQYIDTFTTADREDA